MVQVQQRFLKSGTLLLSLAIAAQLQARRFYDDDPIWREPKPVRVEKVQARKLSDYYDFFLNTFFEPGEKQGRKRSPADRPPIPAQAVNTLGEVPDSGWYQNRRGQTPVSREELVRGPGNDHAPSMSAP